MSTTVGYEDSFTSDAGDDYWDEHEVIFENRERASEFGSALLGDLCLMAASHGAQVRVVDEGALGFYAGYVISPGRERGLVVRYY